MRFAQTHIHKIDCSEEKKGARKKCYICILGPQDEDFTCEMYDGGFCEKECQGGNRLTILDTTCPGRQICCYYE